MAFAVRAHNHLWGKNNEDPFVFLFNQGLSHEFSRQMYLGWNKFGQERPYHGWGIDRPGKFFIPAGLVFPHIVDKELKSVFIISLEDAAEIFMLPGSDPSPVVLGDPDNQGSGETHDIIQGLLRFQKNTASGGVRILPP